MNGPTIATVTAHPGHPSPTARPALPHPAPARSAPPKPGGKADAAAPPPVLTYLRLHWLAIVFGGGLLGGGLAAVAWAVLPAKYESYALLQVASAPSGVVNQNPNEGGQTGFTTHLKTTAQLITSQFVLSSALGDAEYKISELPTIKEQKDPIKFLTEKLVVTYSDSEVVKIGLEGDRPDDVRKIVDAVRDAYYREVVEKERKDKKLMLDKVAQCKADLEAEMKRKPGFTPSAAALANAAAAQKNPVVPAEARTPATPPTVPGADTAVTQAVGILAASPGAAAVTAELLADSDAVKRAKFGPLVNTQAALEQKLMAYPVEIRVRQAAIDADTKRLEALRQAAPSADALARAEKDPDVGWKLSVARDRRKQAQHYRVVVPTPTTPEQVSQDRAYREAAAAADAAAELAKTEKAKLFEAILNQPKSDALVQSLTAATMNLQRLQEQEKIDKALLADTKKQLAEMPSELKRGDEKGPLVDPQRTDLVATDEMYHRLAARQIGLDFELKSPPRVTKLQAASAPSLKDGKKQLLGSVVAGLLGFGLVGLAAVGYEMTARKVCSLGEVKATGPAVVGVIPWQPDGSTARDPIKRADVNESVDKLRAYVAQTWLSRGATTVAVTSPLGDEGKAFTAFGLASSLAQAGYKTLLADFDLRNPTLHALAGLPAGATGVCELLRGEADPRGATLALPNGLHVLPAGKWSDEARQAAVGGRLEALLNRIREPFDVVVLHAHALLTAAESVEVARRAEVVLLCSLYRDTRLPLLKRAADRLATMEVPYAGVVYLGATANEALC